MSKKKPDPADYDSHDAWQEARTKAGMMPEVAKPVPIALLFVLVVGIVAWILAGRLGGTLDEEVLRTGTAEITGECHSKLDAQVCPATITWDDGEEQDAPVGSTEALSGTVDVEEHETFQVSEYRIHPTRRTAKNQPMAWSADHRPTGRPWLFPVVFGGSMLVAIVIAGMIIVFGSRWVRRRSRRRWAFARGVPDRGPEPDQR